MKAADADIAVARKRFDADQQATAAEHTVALEAAREEAQQEVQRAVADNAAQAKGTLIQVCASVGASAVRSNASELVSQCAVGAVSDPF